MSKLFTPIALRSLKIRNRIFVSPMCQYSCVDGIATNWHLVHYGSRAVGGSGMVMVEATAVLPEGRISPSDCGLWNDQQAEAFKPITQFISEHGAIPGVQLAHAGRKASTEPPWLGGKVVALKNGGWQPVAPSSLAFSAGMPKPKALDEKDMEKICAAFVAAAERAFCAGFQVVEVHMAHGYLLHQFLSPLSNQRSDQYGGSLENRMRFPLKVAEKVRDFWPDDLPVLVRISATDWTEKGWDLEQSLELCSKLKEIGIDLIDCSTGGLIPDAVIPVAPGFQVPMAAEIKKEVGIPTGTVGLITKPEQAEQIIVTGQADAVFLARELLRDPQWPLKAAKALTFDYPWPLQYERAKI
ncbi:2,4-dienoyl-CoA reductase [Malonomonas rubra DSM 5091]|uniref:2,4-dienoyl-CoA reductase n=1 Tax=Malonomonas rubra DSM 5091 TaxID=1122189 RepID=A0A1M6JB62_MALRU|nr:NADH:flavin oxidoreductase/NADH oxidase [Malonomonas rubra]SHJ43949.1 2,4-dienoyl-CoA reductase [Malonomonas rubra DSM 5091]